MIMQEVQTPARSFFKHLIINKLAIIKIANLFYIVDLNYL